MGHTDKQLYSLSRIFSEAMNSFESEGGINIDQLCYITMKKFFSKEIIHRCLQHIVTKLDQDRN